MNFKSLVEWQEAVYPTLQNLSFTPPAKVLADKLTALAYFFWGDSRIESEFWKIELAFLCAFKCFGLISSRIVTNKITPTMREFSEKHPNVSLVVEPKLEIEHDGVKALCIECISRMHTRFETDYVLTIQTDGMPVNSGIEEFIGNYDYIGSPWPRFIGYTDFWPYPKFGVGNGGFSLRSKAICVAASKAYGQISRWIPYCQTMFGDDVFYCRTMPLISRCWRRNFKIAPIEIAARFAIESVTPFTPEKPPIGFHNRGFINYTSQFGVPFKELLPDISC